VAGAGEARIFVLAIDDVEQSLECARLVREHFPQLEIVALRELGLTRVERETLDSSLMSARSVLELLGYERHQARTLALRFRRHSVELLEEMAPHIADEKRLVALAEQGREQLEQTWAREREQQQHRAPHAGWHKAEDGR
jgi:glutathione-regulated potassium-efflux system ancillary protein KefC